MNPVHLHLVVNHVPVIGVPIAALLAVFGALRREPAVERAGLLLLVAVALTAPVAYLTGSPAEDALARVPEVSGPAVEEHEEAAQWALIASILTGVAAAGALVLARHRGSMPAVARAIVLALAVLSILSLTRTANLGGLVHHPELREATVTR